MSQYICISNLIMKWIEVFCPFVFDSSLHLSGARYCSSPRNYLKNLPRSQLRAGDSVYTIQTYMEI